MSNLDDILLGLAAEKERIAMTDEMARRVGVDQILARRVLALENVSAREENRPVDMEIVANAIAYLAKK